MFPSVPEKFVNHDLFRGDLNREQLIAAMPLTYTEPKPGNLLFVYTDNQLMIAYYAQPFKPVKKRNVKPPELEIRLKTLSRKDLEERFSADPQNIINSLITILHYDFDRTLTIVHSYERDELLNMILNLPSEIKQKILIENILFKEHWANLIKFIFKNCPRYRQAIASNCRNITWMRATLQQLLGDEYLAMISSIQFGEGYKMEMMADTAKIFLENKQILDVVNHLLIDDDFTNNIQLAYASGAVSSLHAEKFNNKHLRSLAEMVNAEPPSISTLDEKVEEELLRKMHLIVLENMQRISITTEIRAVGQNSAAFFAHASTADDQAVKYNSSDKEFDVEQTRKLIAFAQEVTPLASPSFEPVGLLAESIDPFIADPIELAADESARKLVPNFTSPATFSKKSS